MAVETMPFRANDNLLCPFGETTKSSIILLLLLN